MNNESFFQRIRGEIYPIIKHCQENVPYYQNQWKFTLPPEEDFSYSFFNQNIPWLDKPEIQKNNDLLIANQYHKGQLLVEATSGTEGVPLSCYKTSEERLEYSRILWNGRKKRVKNLAPKDKFAHFFAFRWIDGNLSSDKIIYDNNTIHIPLVNLCEERLQESWKALVDYEPRWLQGPATAVYNLARTGAKHNLGKIALEYIELNGEYVPPEYLEYIQSVFQCQVGNHYGSREFWALAYSCENNHLHILDKSIYIETVFNPEFQENEILITSLKSRSWPLVRYKIGDLADIYEANDDCAFSGKYCLNIKRGRRASYFQLSDGKNINAIVFSVIAKKIQHPDNHLIPAIRQYQAVKISDSHLVINLCVDESIKNTKFIVEKFDYELRKIIGAKIQLEYLFHEMIQPDPKTGKYKEFIDLSR